MDRKTVAVAVVPIRRPLLNNQVVTQLERVVIAQRQRSQLTLLQTQRENPTLPPQPQQSRNPTLHLLPLHQMGKMQTLISLQSQQAKTVKDKPLQLRLPQNIRLLQLKQRKRQMMMMKVRWLLRRKRSSPPLKK